MEKGGGENLVRSPMFLLESDIWILDTCLWLFVKARAAFGSTCCINERRLVGHFTLDIHS